MFKSILQMLWPFARPTPVTESEILICPRCGGQWRLRERNIHYSIERRVIHHLRWSCRECGRAYEEWETRTLIKEGSTHAFA